MAKPDMADGCTVELLAPAGNFECMKAAIAMGADAVYLSGKRFGARSYADNFDDGELREAVRYAHLRGVSMHITVNTVIGDLEMNGLEEYLRFLSDIGVDAVIVQDLAVAKIARKFGLCLHASTQLTVHNLSGARAARELGFSRVVLARELSFDEIKHIAENSGIEVEIFIHGAMCMSYSGQCLMSSVLGGRSGNRGRCAQPCRQPYRTKNGEKTVLSLKDMSLIENISDILESGAVSLKIEGRMKGAAYVAEVVRTYRACIDEKRRPSEKERKRLSRIFNRGGFTNGYAIGKIGPDMFAFEKPDNPYLNESRARSQALLDMVRERSESFQIPLIGRVRLCVGEKMRLEAECGGISVCRESDKIAEKAVSRPTDETAIRNQILKTGGSVFRFKNLEINCDGVCFIPIKAINELRRCVLGEIEERILENYKKNRFNANLDKNLDKYDTKEIPERNGLRPRGEGFTASIRTREQLSALLDFEKDRGVRLEYIGVPIDELLNFDYTELSGELKNRIIIEPSAVMHKSEYEEYEKELETLKEVGFDKLRVHNISEMFRSEDFVLFGSHRLNITNRISAETAQKNMGLGIIEPSAELSLPQVRDICRFADVELGVYGYLPIMLTENCIIKNLSGCPCDNSGVLTDRFGKEFPIVRDGSSCRNVLLNSRPTYTADKLKEVMAVGARYLKLSFTIEDADEVERVCDAYLCGGEYRPREYTRLHLYNGIFKDL